jgi:Na+-transporting methylmalonyl-CoA/oxaloacetate decarboxylase gamma subunit
MSVLISSGINLMLTGMITVFIFLAILIVLINISALLLKDDNKVVIENNLTIPLNNNSEKVPEEHLKIINHINKRIFNG